MITKDNIKSVFDALKEAEINKALDSNKDMILLTVGGYGSVHLSSHHYKRKHEKTAENTGGVFCDKDVFLQLFIESESVNPFLIERI